MYFGAIVYRYLLQRCSLEMMSVAGYIHACGHYVKNYDVDCAKATATVCEECEWTNASAICCLTHLRMTQRDVNTRDAFALGSSRSIAMKDDSWCPSLVGKDLDVFHCSAGAFR